jgi:predicted nucleotidyltransferase
MPAIVELPSLARRPELARQYELLVRLRHLLKDEPHCLGAAVGGSLASGNSDEMSDVDLVVYCEAGAAQSILKKLSVAAADRPVVHRLVGKHDAHSAYEKVILQDWCSYELHVIEPTTRMRLRPPYVEIVDRNGYLASRVSEDKPIGRGTARPYVNGDDGLIWELFNCVKWLRRGEAEFTVQYLQELGERLKLRGLRGEA